MDNDDQKAVDALMAAQRKNRKIVPCKCAEQKAEQKAEIERLQAALKEAAKSLAENEQEIERLRYALERIESNIGFSKTFLQKIAREALRDD